MLPRHARFKVDGVTLESIDSVRYSAALTFARSVATAERRWPQLESLAQQDVDVDADALIGELDALARLSPPPGLSGVLGSIRDDALKGLAATRKR